MTKLHLSDDSQHAAEEQIEGLPAGFGEGLPGRIAYWIALTFSLFQIWIAAYGPLASQIVRAMHVGFLLLLGFVLIGNLLARNRVSQGFYWLLGIAGFATGVYNWVFYRDILLRSNFLTTVDLAMGVVLLVLVFWLARRLMGWPLFIIACAFLGYCAFGENLPGMFGHRGYDATMLIEHFAFGTEGIYGSPVYVSSAYIFIFVVFAAFLERAGMLDLFNDVALGLVGHWRGGAAQVCTLSSALMGTISGSGVANVVASGQFTIPLMKKFGFRASFAGGVEATSSMGGQIMPPIMGAVAFIMAETLNIPYGDVVRAALIPAAMYFGVCFWNVYLESGKHNLRGLPRDQLPSPWAAIKKQWMLMIPLGMLVYLLFADYTPIFAGSMGLALVVVLILATAIAATIGPFVFRIVFWISVGLASAAFLKYGVDLLMIVIGVLLAACFLLRGAREALVIVRDSLALGARNALPVAAACAIVGIVIGTLTLTGIASTFIGAVIRIGENNLFLSLVLVMITCLVLGMGIPTIPNYIITSSLAGPALEQLGVPLLVSHMFVFYFGIMADLTPPVALACFAAAPMAKVSGLKISIDATKLAIAGFIMPFIAVYSPALMLQEPYPGSYFNEQFGFWAEVAFVTFKAALAIGLWGVAVVGYLIAPARLWERVWAFGAGVALVLASPQSDVIGFALAALFLLQHWLRHRGPRRQVPA
ncbi:TRAP transporter permease [Paracoccus siganidrum]|uniref:TRAP transporter permease n=1 Tax=Paracoccus siganidrum TaxID=1276757 RepID=A0A419A816_9RHOB|nr:TRAP transporter permease [Paracoccus siganidrum]RJL18174.1 TRAP transporter permease [Paracoccus siganidrum]RMC30254.1 TRAP transporter permease [Paracoccus siganidrum]